MAIRKRKKLKLKYSRERILFSDVLPYETPLIFSNRFLYRFVTRFKLHIKSIEVNPQIGKKFQGYRIVSSRKDLDTDAMCFAYLLFGLKDENDCFAANELFNPFQFDIAHRPGKNRILSVIHPFCQLQVVDFYDQYRHSILYLCSKSSYSIRKPTKIAKYFYYHDRLHSTLLGKKRDSIELYFNEYENLRTYFSYQKYSNIYKFYEDYRYQRAEKKFRYLLKFDLQSCFDSIYSHSISWATGGGRVNVKHSLNYKGNWVGDAFDSLMQSVNARETNGIVIGPEFSRLFAEIILQHIDEVVEHRLQEQELINKKHYECFRYVDDYFLFYNDDRIKDIVINNFTEVLSEFKLKISPSKTILYERPFITGVSRAKLEINKLIRTLTPHKVWDNKQSPLPFTENEDELKDNAEIVVERQDSSHEEKEIDINQILGSKIYLFVDSNNFIAQLKAIISNFDVAYNDVANYTLEILGRKIDSILKSFDIVYKQICIHQHTEKTNDDLSKIRKSAQKRLAAFLKGVVDISFFIYNSNRQINTTLKIQKLLNSVVIYMRNDYIIVKDKILRFNDCYREEVLKKIQDELSLVLSFTDEYVNTPHESIYLLVLAKSLGYKHRLSPVVIKKCMEAKSMTYNMFTCQVLLFYFGNLEKYKFLKDILWGHILHIYDKYPIEHRHRYAELCILTADLMMCPFIDRIKKIELLKLMGITDNDNQNSILHFGNKYKNIFTKWSNFDMNKELMAKISQEVYS